MARLPTIYTVWASDAIQPAATLQQILQKLKMETRISDFVMLDIDDNVSSLMDTMNDGDLILILLTIQLGSQKSWPENKLAFKTNRPGVTVAEIIIDNIPYENSFITFPLDFKPIRDRDDSEAIWSSIAQSLKDMFPVNKIHQLEPEPQLINKRLEAVENHPEYPALLQVKPSDRRLYWRFGCASLFGVIFTLVSLLIIWVGSTAGGSFPTFYFVLPLLFSAVGIGITVWGIFRLIKLSGSKLTKPTALVVDKRIAVTGGGQNSSSSTHYYITLELGDGERRELEAAAKVYGMITKDDVGVAYIRDEFLLDYRRIVGL